MSCYHIISTLENAAKAAQTPQLQAASKYVLSINSAVQVWLLFLIKKEFLNLSQHVRSHKSEFEQLADDASRFVYRLLVNEGSSTGNTYAMLALVKRLAFIDMLATSEAKRGLLSRAMRYRTSLDRINEYHQDLGQLLIILQSTPSNAIQGNAAGVVQESSRGGGHRSTQFYTEAQNGEMSRSGRNQQDGEQIGREEMKHYTPTVERGELEKLRNESEAERPITEQMRPHFLDPKGKGKQKEETTEQTGKWKKVLGSQKAENQVDEQRRTASQDYPQQNCTCSHCTCSRYSTENATTLRDANLRQDGRGMRNIFIGTTFFNNNPYQIQAFIVPFPEHRSLASEEKFPGT